MSAKIARRWWSSDPRERFWIELTDRLDIGADLRFPKADEAGRDNWRYTLFLDALPGNVVFHYDKKEQGIVGRSIIAGSAVSRRIVWAAKGSSARDKGTQPYEREGWVVPLENHLRFERVISLNDLRQAKEQIQRIERKLRDQHGKASLYFPFELSDKRPLRMLQGYAFKLPRDVVELFPGMCISVDSVEEEAHFIDVKAPSTPRRGQGFGGSAAVNISIERHAMEVATAYFRRRGYDVTDISATKPYDLIISRGDEVLTVEVKGTTSAGEKIIVTRNEVDHAREVGNCILFIVKNVKIKQVGNDVKSQDGEPVVIWPWHIGSGSLQPISYFYSVPLDASKGEP